MPPATISPEAALPAEVLATERRRRKATLGSCCGAHFLHDGFSDVIYLFLPIWQAEFALTLTQVGLIKSLYVGALSAGQMPFGLLAERCGERSLLAIGTVITGAGYMLLGFAGGAVALSIFLMLAGLGSAAQHPLSSSIVSRAYEAGGQRAALGIYNFSGDLGKAAVPALAAVVVASLDWRWATTGYGAIGVLGGIAVFIALLALRAGAVETRPVVAAHRPRQPIGWGISDRRGFGLLSAIAMIDTATRMAFLTFLPFLLIGKGATVGSIGFALALVFIGGAAGKFLCGVLAERIGITRTVVLTEIVTGGGILLILALPLLPILVLLPVIGAALNGTSSVLYGTLPAFVAPERRSRGFALFYTLGIAGGAVSPTVFGIVSDIGGVVVTLAIIGAMVLATLPLALVLRPLLPRS